jgi:beta-lysine 5,6-aminomutase beta subunit
MKTRKDNRIRPYGDKLNDGMVQLSFTLPLKVEVAKEAGQKLASKMGLLEPQVVFEKDIGEGFTFVIVYGRCSHSVDVSTIRAGKAVDESMDFYQVNDFIKQKLKRKIVIVGACIESDAHTVGIDAILNMKGYHGNYGLERYPMFEVVNMGAQVPSEELIKNAKKINADVILVSQVVTQGNIHLHHLTKLIDLLEAERLRRQYIVIVGGPVIDNKFAKELGYDAGFGRGTLPGNVAAFIAKRMAQKVASSSKKKK